MQQAAGRVWLFFLDLIFPIECLGCGRAGSWLCENCFKAISLKPKQYCLRCKRENDFGEFCPACGVDYSLDGMWIASLYENELIGRAIKSLKYHFVQAVAEDLGKLLIALADSLLSQARMLKPGIKRGVGWNEFDRIKNLPAVILNFKESLVVPVPLAKKRWRWRGFNQAEILGKIFAAQYGLEMNARDLIRIKHKKAQAKLDEASRQENIKKCFAWRGENLRGRNVILIDDVVTTGATLNECAKILKAGGAGTVWGLVVAKG